jgi:hypothetical protein
MGLSAYIRNQLFERFPDVIGYRKVGIKNHRARWHKLAVDEKTHYFLTPTQIFNVELPNNEEVDTSNSLFHDLADHIYFRAARKMVLARQRETLSYESQNGCVLPTKRLQNSSKDVVLVIRSLIQITGGVSYWLCIRKYAWNDETTPVEYRLPARFDSLAVLKGKQFMVHVDLAENIFIINQGTVETTLITLGFIAGKIKLFSWIVLPKTQILDAFVTASVVWLRTPVEIQCYHKLKLAEGKKWAFSQGTHCTNYVQKVEQYIANQDALVMLILSQ